MQLFDVRRSLRRCRSILNEERFPGDAHHASVVAFADFAGRGLVDRPVGTAGGERSRQAQVEALRSFAELCLEAMARRPARSVSVSPAHPRGRFPP